MISDANLQSLLILMSRRVVPWVLVCILRLRRKKRRWPEFPIQMLLEAWCTLWCVLHQTFTQLDLSVGSKQIMALLIEKQWNGYSDTSEKHRTTCYATKYQTCAKLVTMMLIGVVTLMSASLLQVILSRWMAGPLHGAARSKHVLHCLHGCGIHCWFYGCSGGCLVEESPSRVALSHALRSMSMYIVIVRLLLPTLRTPSIMEKPHT